MPRITPCTGNSVFFYFFYSWTFTDAAELHYARQIQRKRRGEAEGKANREGLDTRGSVLVQSSLLMDCGANVGMRFAAGTKQTALLLRDNGNVCQLFFPQRAQCCSHSPDVTPADAGGGCLSVEFLFTCLVKRMAASWC